MTGRDTWTIAQTHRSDGAVFVPAPEPGALDHYAATCSCGLVIANSLGLAAAEADLRSHLAWGAARDADARRARNLPALCRCPSVRGAHEPTRACY